MKTVVLITGQTRSFGQTFRDQNGGHFRVFESQCWQLYRHLTNAVFVVSVADDAEAKDMDLLRGFCRVRSAPVDVVLEKEKPIVHIERVKQPAHIAELPEYGTTLQAATPYRISATIQNILKQLWAYQRGWEYMRELGVAIESDDIVIRLRPDLFFQRFDKPGRWPTENEAFTCRWGRYGGVNDRFAILGRQAAQNWFTALEYLPALIAACCPIHPETIQSAAMELRGTKIRHILRAEFTGVRPDGQMIPPVYLPYDTMDVASASPE